MFISCRLQRSVFAQTFSGHTYGSSVISSSGSALRLMAEGKFDGTKLKQREIRKLDIYLNLRKCLSRVGRCVEGLSEVEDLVRCAFVRQPSITLHQPTRLKQARIGGQRHEQDCDRRGVHYQMIGSANGVEEPYTPNQSIWLQSFTQHPSSSNAKYPLPLLPYPESHGSRIYDGNGPELKPRLSQLAEPSIMWCLYRDSVQGFR